MQLRPYQEVVKRQTYDAMKRVKRVMIQMPTGAGKTFLFVSILSDAVPKGYKGGILVHREELIGQAVAHLDKYGIRSSVIQGKRIYDNTAPIGVASVQTLIRRELPPDWGIIITDEAHHSTSDSYNKIYDNYPDIFKIGVTATPCRLNGQGFRDQYDELVQGPTIPDLIRLGALVAPKYYVAPLKLEKIKVSAGDYNLRELSEEYQRRVSPEVLVKNWLKLANKLKTIGFAIDVQHSKDIVNCYNRFGIPAAHIDGKTPEHERISKIRDFKDGRILVLFNVGVFDEGFDVPAIEAVQLARPTKSLVKWMQMVGRSLRPANGKNQAIVLDHGNLIGEHDKVEIEREWTLDGVKKKDSGRKTVCRDKRTGKTYDPMKLPLDIPMENIELVELACVPMSELKKRSIETEYHILKRFALNKNYKPFWVWFRLADKLVKNITDKEKAKEKLKPAAEVFCEDQGFKPGRAFYLIDEYINKNIVSKS